MPRPILATVHVPALSHNLETVAGMLSRSATVPRPSVWAVIKANAYGHGIEPAVEGFAQADGLAMLDLDEAVRCREHGWSGPLLLLEGFFEPADIEVLDHYRITTAIHCAEQLEMLEAGQVRHALDAFVKLNSGMHRLGFQPDQYRAAYRRALDLQAEGVLGAVGKMTHFARADDDPVETAGQLRVFAQVTEGLPGPVSVCNSAATLTEGLAAGVSGGEQWVRPGICLYGGSPFDERSAESMGLRPAMTLSSRLISTHTVPAGGAVGYGHCYVAERATRVGVVACGYADGYPRHAPTGTPITVEGVRTRVLGRVSMDMLVADLDPVPQARVGSPVVLWGEGGPSVDEVARPCGTIGYELLCAVAPRVPRRVQGAGAAPSSDEGP
ncbi:alanine racemase [Castellaniella sp. GW247-6E4]|uniref:alanine racemase n=1 Tax=Castellaniella sp. GW247-6E4 TaxID=3140380 RepID=UPI00331554F7